MDTYAFVLFMLAQTQVGPLDRVEVTGSVTVDSGSVRGRLNALFCGSASVSAPIIDSKLPAWTRSFPLQGDPKKGIVLRFKKEPGHYLSTVAWARTVDSQLEDVQTHYVDGRWHRIHPSGSRETVEALEFVITPAITGDVEIALGEGVRIDLISFLPADAKGEIPDWSQTRVGGTFEERVSDVGKAVFKGMKPGRYVFFPTSGFLPTGQPRMTVSVEVKAKETVKAVLGPGSK
jgi:hypothetical protein